MLVRRTALSLAYLPLALLVACTGDDSATSESATDTASSVTATTSPTTTATATTTATTATTATGTASEGTSTTTSPTTGETDPTTTTTTGVSATDTTTDTTTDPTTGTTTTGTTGGECPEGTILCDGNVAQTCDGMGGFSSEEDCGDQVCAEGLGCVLCVPGEGTCDGDMAKYCNDEGDGYVEDECDPLQGLSCSDDLGQCVGPCSKQALGLSYIGCNYYPTVLPQHDSYNNSPKDDFAIAVSNTTGQVATVTVTRGGNTVVTDTVAANSVKAIKLPWVNETSKGTGPSKVSPGAAYRLRSDQPVTAYQYNPIASTTTNDASLLLPVNAWTGNYMVAAWKHASYPGFYAVVASEDGTTVTLKPSTTGGSVQAGGGVQANGTGQATLNAGDVLVVQSSSGDVTGSIVEADKPVQAFGGHKCTQVPPGACDHLEEAILPIEALAKEYLVVPTAQYPNANLDKPQVIKIVAAEDDTTLTYDPDQPAAKSLAKAGDFVEIPATTAHFKVSADKKILVAQFMVGQSGNTGESDPAFVQAIPTDQFRNSYLFHAPPSWTANYVDIIAPDGAAAEVDGMAVGGWKPIGNSGFSIAHVKLDNGGDGNHSVTADEKVGISVYGVQSYGSYWYPGGTDLVVIPQ